MKISHLIIYALVMALWIPVQGTDGYFSLGYGTRNKGLAGAGVAMYHVSLINGNPAGNVLLGDSYTIGVALFNPNRQYNITGNPSGLPGTFGLTPGTVESDSKTFIIPNLGANWALGENNAFAIALYGNGGMNTNYPTQTFHDQSSTTTGVDLAQLFASFSFSQRITGNHFIGLSGIVAYQYFEAKGLSTFGNFSSDPTKLSNNKDDSSLGVGFKVGYMGELTEGLSIGATYQSKIFMKEFEEYAGLYAENGDFDIPSSWSAGLSFSPNDDWTFLFDVKQILYSGVKSVSNPMDLMANSPSLPDGTQNPNFIPLGAEEGWGFGWEDMTVLKFGIEYGGVENWMFRGGFSYGKQPIPESEVLFNILAPGIIENHLALGLSRKVNEKGMMVNFALNYAFNNKVSGYNPLDFDAEQAQMGNIVPNQMIDLEMNQLEIELGLTF